MDDPTEVVKKLIVHMSHGYTQHGYNRTIHSSTHHNPFHMCFGFLPLAPLDVAMPSQSFHLTPHAEQEAEKAARAHDLLEQTNLNYKHRHDIHRVPHTFQVGDKVWLRMQKERLRS